MNEPKPVRVQDVVDYHEDKDNCHICLQGEWWCPRHQFDHNYKDSVPRHKTAIDDGFRPAIPWKSPKPRNPK